MNKSDYRSQITKSAYLKKVAGIESLIAKVDGMTEQQRLQYIAESVKRLGGWEKTLESVKNTLASMAVTTKQATLYEGLKNQPKTEPTPSQLSQKLNNAGDWVYLLTLLLFIGTAGASDMGGDWKQIFKGFALTIGSGFLGWAAKKLSTLVK